MDTKKLQERIKKSEEKLAKLQNTLSKHLAKLQKIYQQYAEAKELHTLLPLDLFIKFDTETYYNWRDEQDFMKEVNHSICAIHNKEAVKRYIAECNNHGTIAKMGVREFLYNAEEIVGQIVNKRREIEETQSRISEYEKTLRQENKKVNSVEALFEKVPTLKEFIERCGETQYAFLVYHNKAIKEAWERYYKLDREACDIWNKGGDPADYREKVKEAKKAKPKTFVRTEEQIREEVERWKINESKLMAERIKTEFGEVINTNLYLGADGNVNGTIQGTEKTADINTIFAGGYNIQCLHTRLLVHEK